MPIRRARPADFESLIPVWDDLHNHHVAALPHVFHNLKGKPLIPRADYLARLADPQQLTLVADAEGQIIGFLWAFRRSLPAGDATEARQVLLVDMIGVISAYRGGGTGTDLMAEAERWGREHGAREIALNVWAANRDAIRFYEGLGYETELLRMVKTIDKGGA
jgi:ribosomal protein S18 acetylase RimI-like enzyme